MILSAAEEEELGDKHREERELSRHSISFCIFGILYDVLGSFIQKYKIIYFLKPFACHWNQGTQCIKPVY